MSVKLNLGCAAQPIKGYINIDLDTVETMKERYPEADIDNGTKIYQYDIFNLPYESSSVDEVRCDSLIEHLSFVEEKSFFEETTRVLKKGGKVTFSTPDFEDTVKRWLKAEDNWKDFYRNDTDAIKNQHWFGQYSYTMNQRWGYLTASIFGSQNGDGQFHKNCYTEGKIIAILNFMGYEGIEVERYLWKDNRELMLRTTALKK